MTDILAAAKTIASARRDRTPLQPLAADVAQAVEAYLPAIEIVDDRYADWQTLGAPTLVADDFFAAGCVLGEQVARSAAPDLLDIVGRAVINGVEDGRGTGADVLGHPHHALAWLANHLAADGKALRAGRHARRTRAGRCVEMPLPTSYRVQGRRSTRRSPMSATETERIFS
jgi:2-keto-4-pentenoate hydratase